jgi:protein-S-isoprenylcysteine O-methyltransferase Ste14
LRELQRVARCGGILATTLIMAGTLAGCVAVGYSSRGGWFFWLRGFGLLFILILLVFLLWRRR